MNPPRAKPEPASLFRGSRSGSLQDQVLMWLRSAAPFAGLSDPQRGTYRPRYWAWGRLEVLAGFGSWLLCPPLIYPPTAF